MGNGNSYEHIFRDMEKERSYIEEEMNKPYGNELLEIVGQIEELKEKMTKLLQMRYEIEKQNGKKRVEKFRDYRFSARDTYEISREYRELEMKRPYGKEIWEIEEKIEELKNKSKNLLERRKEIEDQKKGQ